LPGSLQSSGLRSTPRILRNLFLLGLWVATSLATGQTQDARQAAQPKQTDSSKQTPTAYAGSETCKTCHEELYTKGFEHTSHFALTKEGKHGCEDCHGPGTAHVEGGGDKTKIFSFKGLNAKQVSERCLGCHQGSLEHSNYSRSVHLSNGVSCLDCHSPHHATEPDKLLVNKQPLLCYGCHAQQKAEFARPYRHRVDVGLVACSDCHNPHGSTIQKQLRKAAGGFAVCSNCHAEKMGPFVYEHVPVKTEGCGSCHTPHGSTNPRLLRVSLVNLLCLQCHSPTANNPVPEAPSFHAQNTQFQACTLCHTQIHGSNLDRFFFK
jgi:DmsE family decaheme c-type cytochrome